MALEEQGQQAALSLIKKLFKNLLRRTANILIRPLVKKIDTSVENHQMHSLKQLVRKNPNMGIHAQSALSATQAKLIGKELKKMQQDFFIEQAKDEDGKTVYNVYCTNGNKSLVENLKVKTADRASEIDKRPTLPDRLSAARQKSNELNKANQQHRQHMAEKHKDISL